jgi:LPXTG-site transpeptidase (sortase) family protein
MDSNDNKHGNQFDASLPLPSVPPSQTPQPSPEPEAESNPAAELIRKKVEAAYQSEPNATAEALEVEELGSSLKRSRHQQYIYDLTNSGKSLAEIQAGWHEYYAGLPDNEKHAVWQEFYSAHALSSHYTAAASSMAPAIEEKPLEYELTPVKDRVPQQRANLGQTINRTLADMRDMAMGSVSNRKKIKPMQHFQSLLFGVGVGSVVILIFLFSFFNERFIAPFIQPSRNVSGTPIISSDAASGNVPEVIIPKINVEIPVVYGVNTINEAAVENALEDGVVHYADTATPGQNGNAVIVGHSSNNIFNKGKYKFAFVLLSRLDNGDTFYLQKDGKRYTYQVYKKEIVKPTDVSVLGTADKPATATLITCDPPGTSINRLVVLGQQISPDPINNTEQTASNALATKAVIVPGNSPSLWSRIKHLF